MMNTSEPVGILFHERIIARLFAELVSQHGVAVEVVQELSKLPSGKIITEASYFHELAPERHGECLVVGSPQQLKGIKAATLVQPLTEDGIVQALDRFLEQP